MATDALNPSTWPPLPPRHSRLALVTAGVLTAGAAAVHFAVVPEHLNEYPLFGVFFLVLGAGQAVVAIVLMMLPRRRLCLTAMCSTAALVLLWLVSRTIGLPFGPEPGNPETVGVPDLVCVALETVSLPV